MAIAGVGAAALAYSVYAGQQQQAAQKKARERTQLAQDEALRQQMIERQRTVQQEMQANRATPASSIVLNDALGAPTDKTGGVDDRLRLSRPTKLGGGI
jgi:uncharacterized protein HemX